MRHQRVINHLGRTSSHRKAMLANMATSLIIHKRITTTTAKAKALRTYIEPLLTKSKQDSTHSRREVFSHLQDKEAVTVLFREISPKIADRQGGYTRILKTGNRVGDNAETCIIELVDFNELRLGSENKTTKSAGRRRRSSSKKKPATPEAAAAQTEAGAPADVKHEPSESETDKTAENSIESVDSEGEKEG